VGLNPDGQYQFLQSFNHGKNVYALTLADGRDNMLISAGQNEKDEWTIKVWDIERARVMREMKGHTNYIFSVVMPNPNQVVSCSYDETIRVWDFENGANITIFKEFKVLHLPYLDLIQRFMCLVAT
jgi:WD40 repeat protein